MRSGGCLCGAVRWTISTEPTKVTYCHCSKCRRWHGHVGAYTGVERVGFELVQDRGLAWFQQNPKVKRGFCKECGSSLFWDEEGEARISVCAGTFDHPSGLVSKAHIYVGSKGDYYELPEDGLMRLDEFK